MHQCYKKQPGPLGAGLCAQPMRTVPGQALLRGETRRSPALWAAELRPTSLRASPSLNSSHSSEGPLCPAGGGPALTSPRAAVGSRRNRVAPVKAMRAVIVALPERLVELIGFERDGRASFDQLLKEAILGLVMPSVMDDHEV